MKNLPILTFALAAAAFAAWAAPSTVRSQQTPPGPASEDNATAESDSPRPAAQDNGDADENTARNGAAQAQAALAQAREKLGAYKSIRSGINQVVDLGERRFRATGTYLQSSNLKLRLEYQVQVGASSGSLLEVCDGQRLWTRHTIDGQPRIMLRDVRQILDAVPNKDFQSMLTVELGLGGLPALFASIEENMAFHSLREETVDERQPPMIVIEGTWNKRTAEGWKSISQDGERLPDHVPDSIRIYFQQKNLFPRRIVYLKKHPTRDFSRPLVTLDFVDVVVNAPVNDDEFYFVPPDGVPQEDVTRAYIERIQAAGQAAQPDEGNTEGEN
jgi:outer membrane lipoprotein-sorting protein